MLSMIHIKFCSAELKVLILVMLRSVWAVSSVTISVKLTKGILVINW